MNSVYIGGMHRPFNLSPDALELLDHSYGLSVVDGSLFRVKHVKEMRDIVFVALSECDPAITQAQVGAWLTFANAPAVLSTILETLVTESKRAVPKLLRNKELNRTQTIPDFAVRVALESLQLTAQDVFLHLGAGNANAIKIAVAEYGVSAVIACERELGKYNAVMRTISDLHKGRQLVEKYRLHMCNVGAIPLVDLMRATAIFVNLTQDGVLAVEDMLRTETSPFTRVVVVGAALRSIQAVSTVRAECLGGIGFLIRTYVLNTRKSLSRHVPYNASPAADHPIPAPEPQQTRPDPVPQQDEPAYSGNQPIPNETIFGDGGSLVQDPPVAGKESQ